MVSLTSHYFQFLHYFFAKRSSVFVLTTFPFFHGGNWSSCWNLSSNNFGSVGSKHSSGSISGYGNQEPWIKHLLSASSFLQHPLVLDGLPQNRISLGDVFPQVVGADSS